MASCPSKESSEDADAAFNIFLQTLFSIETFLGFFWVAWSWNLSRLQVSYVCRTQFEFINAWIQKMSQCETAFIPWNLQHTILANLWVYLICILTLSKFTCLSHFCLKKQNYFIINNFVFYINIKITINSITYLCVDFQWKLIRIFHYLFWGLSWSLGEHSSVWSICFIGFGISKLL